MLLPHLPLSSLISGNLGRMLGDAETEGRGYKYSRKDKSLGLLCTNFMNLYKNSAIDLVCLDDAAGRLGVERRRIYDIVNVLESVGVIVRKGKNRYSWIGLSGIPQALENLKEEALKEIEGITLPKPSPLIDYQDDESEVGVSNQTTGFVEEHSELNFSAALGNVFSKDGSVMENRREKSLGLFTQNFVKLFLITGAKVISLDEAAKLLLGDGYSSQMKNNAAKVRRLYDIANVLSSLSLIEKTQNSESRKPAFRWLGFNGRLANAVRDSPAPNPEHPNKRIFGLDITNADFKKRKTTSTMQNKIDVIKECNLTVQRQLQSSSGFVYGPFCPTREGKKDIDVVHEKRACDWDTLTDSFHPRYHNQALSELFAHYMEAWKSWYDEVAHGVKAP